MGLIRSRDTKPEMTVRRLVHGMGYRFRLHGRDLPGRPDLVFKARSKVIFVHGCFWHLHAKCANNRPPKSSLDYWKPKLERNVARDKMAKRRLNKLGWSVLVIWECELADRDRLQQRIDAFLSDA
jgi:DNA mismatch endonuclease (patch repair protein)